MTIGSGKTEKNRSETDAKKQDNSLFIKSAQRSSGTMFSLVLTVVLAFVLIGIGVFFVHTKQIQKEAPIIAPETEPQLLPTPFDEETREEIALDDDVVRGSDAVATIFIASIPPVADIYLSEKLIGKTNVSNLKIPCGVHTLRFVKGGRVATKKFELKPGRNPSQMVRIP